MSNPYETDLLVYGATPCGIACAVRAAREGLRVILVDHLMHIGGFLSSGAGGWETPCDYQRSPLYAEVCGRITAHYREVYGEGSAQYLASMPQADSRRHIDRAKVEPRIAEKVFDAMVDAEGTLTVWRGWYPVATRRDGRRLVAATLRRMGTTGDGIDETREVVAASYADGSYVGDLAAVAGVAMRVGREGRSEYGEPHAGRVFTSKTSPIPGHGRWPVESDTGELNLRSFGHTAGAIIYPESTGEADEAVMAYNYRLILTCDPDNRLPAPCPSGYDATLYRGLNWGSIVPNLPNRKIAWNAGRLIGPQHAYPAGDWATRHRIDREYLDYILGQLWYLQHDPEVPTAAREYWEPYGLARDEFPDNGHLPYEVYVREGRRLVGRHVFTEHDGVPVPGQQRPPIHADSVATTDWPLDSVACHITTVENSANEGVYFLAHESRPAQVPWRCLLPHDVDNLMVPLCLSSSHVGWGALRLEPVWIQTGEAAGFAAALALRQGIAVADVDPLLLVRTLVERRFMVTFFNDVDVADADAAAWAPAVQALGTLGFFRDFDARPTASLGADAATWTARWRELSPRATALDGALARRDAAALIYEDLRGG